MYGLRESSDRTDQTKREKVYQTVVEHLSRMQKMQEQLDSNELPDAGNVFKSLNNTQQMKKRVNQLFYELVQDNKPAMALAMYEMLLNATDDEPNLYRASGYQGKEQKLATINNFKPEFLKPAALLAIEMTKYSGNGLPPPEALDLNKVEVLQRNYSFKGAGLQKLPSAGNINCLIPHVTNFADAQKAFAALHRAPKYYGARDADNATYKISASKETIDEMLALYPETALRMWAKNHRRPPFSFAA